MSDHDDRGPLGDMLEAAEEAVSLFEAATADELEHDRRTHLAIVYLILIIGEAANRVSAAFRDDHPEIPWRVIIGMRNWLAHAYDQLDRERVHDTVAVHIPRLITRLRAILGEE